MIESVQPEPLNGLNPPPAQENQSSWLGRTWAAVRHPIGFTQDYAGRWAASYVKDNLATEEGQARLVQMAKGWLGHEEGTLFDGVKERFADFYQFLTSQEGEKAAEELFKKAYDLAGMEPLKEAPSEVLVDAELRETVGETALQTCQMMSEYSLNLLDYNALEYAQEHPAGRCIVLDLGRGAETEKGSFERPISNIVDELEFCDDKPPGKFVWIHIQDLPGGRSFWVRREREKMRQEMQHLSKIGLLNLRKQFCDLYDGDHREGAPLSVKNEKLLSECFVAAADHMASYEKMEAGKAPDLTQRTKAAAERGKKLLFPGGAKDYPLPAHLGVALDAVLPMMFSLGIEQAFKKMGEPAMMNKIILNALESVPTPSEIKPTFENGEEPPEVDGKLKEAAGKVVVTLLRSSSTEFRRFYDTLNPKVDTLFDIDLMKELKIQESLGELLAESAVEWFAQFKTADDLLRWCLQSVNEDFLQPKLYEAELVSEEQAAIEEEKEVKKQLGSRLKSFIPYLRSTFFTAFEQNSYNLAQKVIEKIPLIPKRRKITALFYKIFDKFLRKAFSFAGSLKGRFFRIIELEQVEEKWNDRAGCRLAEKALPQFYDVRHREMMMRLTEIFLSNLEGESQLPPAREIRMPPV